jgi:hypothetical protein
VRALPCRLLLPLLLAVRQKQQLLLVVEVALSPRGRLKGVQGRSGALLLQAVPGSASQQLQQAGSSRAPSSLSRQRQAMNQSLTGCGRSFSRKSSDGIGSMHCSYVECPAWHVYAA